MVYTFNKSFKVAVVQIDEHFGDKEYNIEQLIKQTISCAKIGANVILLPELGTTGYKTPTQFWLNREMILPYAEPIPGTTTKRFSEVALTYNCYILIGMVEIDDKTDNLYNSLCVINPKGDVQLVYRKINLYIDDTRWASKGNLGAKVLETPYGNFGLLICYDMHFNNPVQRILSKDIKYILFSTAWDDENPIDNYWRAFAVNNKVTFIAADNANPGESCVINENGEVLSMLEKGKDGFLVYEVKY